MAPAKKPDSATAESGTNLSDLFSRLSLATSSNDFEKVLAISNDILKSSPTDSQAAKQKLIALIKLDKYNDALSFLDECTFLNSKEIAFEKGFCLYKLGKGSEAENVLKEGSGRAVQHVRAQNAYRMEDFATAVKMYADLRQSSGSLDHEADDIKSNYLAARAQYSWNTGVGHGETLSPNESYEACFNIAYESIALGRFIEAEDALNRAERLCSHAGLTGDELKAEQGIILTQLAYLKQIQEPSADAASKIYEDVVNQSSVDATTRAIAINNQLCIQPRSNRFENHRLHSASVQAFNSSKPFLAQSQPFLVNSLLLSSQAHKSNIAAAIKKHQKLHPTDHSAPLIHIFSELGGSSEAAFLNKLSEIFYRDETSVAAGLMLVQTHAQKGNTQMAASVLEKLFHALKNKDEVRFAPGLLSLAVLLFPKAGKEEKATSLLMDAKAYWTKKENFDANVADLVNYATLARIDHLLMLQQSPSHSRELEALIAERNAYLKEHPSDILTSAVLAALYSIHSPSDAASCRALLPPVSFFTKTVNVDQLEAQGVPTGSTLLPPQNRKSISRTRPRKRRVRGGIVFDSAGQVDPERWLPLRERSYYKPTKSKKRKTGGATQGGAVEAENVSVSGSGHVEAKKTDAGGKKKKKTRK